MIQFGLNNFLKDILNKPQCYAKEFFNFIAYYSYKIKEYLKKTLSLHYYCTNRLIEHAILSNLIFRNFLINAEPCKIFLSFKRNNFTQK